MKETQRKIGIGLVLLFALGLLGLAAGALWADVDPPGCTTNAMNMILSRSPGTAHNGDTIAYTVTLTNVNVPGACNVDSLDLTFTAPAADGTATGAVTPLATNATFNVGDSVTYGPFDVVLALNPGVTSATAEAHFEADLHDAEQEDLVTDTKTVTVTILNPAIEVTKVADTEISKAGDTVNYLITVTNTGDTELSGITVGDSILGDLSASFADTLAAGASENHSFPYVVQVGDVDPLVNVVTVEGTDVLDDAHSTVTDTDSQTVDLVHPDFTVTKACRPDPVAPGEDLTYAITITNTGDVALDYHVVDAIIPLDNNYLDNAVGSVLVVNAVRTIGAEEQSPATNTVTVTATLTGGALPNEITKTATASCDIQRDSGATRTPGYWFTHPDAMLAAFACITGDEDGTIVLCAGTCSVDADDAMAIFWKAKGGNRPTLAQHILSAMFNDCLLTSAPGTIIEDALAVLCNPNATSTEIGNAIGPLDAFNNSGDDVPFPPGMNFGSANTAEAKSMAGDGSVPGCAAGKK